MNHREYDVLIIGGGITGAGTARDCARRGLSVLLVEKADFCNGATGRNHGLLHSGARYAVTDPVSARECIEENRILRRIAPHCVDPTDGFFVTLPEDDITYVHKFVQACRAAGIDAEQVDTGRALEMEPSLNPDITAAVKVPDASVDPFRLTLSNVLDAEMHGAETLIWHEAVSLVTEGGRVLGARLRDVRTGEEKEVRAAVTVNASGIWGQAIAAMAGTQIRMLAAKGALLVFGHRVNRMVVNRCRKPSDGDIIVPGEVVCVAGTTSSKVPFEEVDNLRVTPEEAALLLRESSALMPSLRATRVIRAYAGVRPLVAADDDPTGRKTSRGIVCLDHAVRDGIEGLVSITGGKMMTYRRMAEEAADVVCAKLGNTAKCDTASALLPLVEAVEEQRTKGEPLICECEEIDRAGVQHAVETLGARSLGELRRRTRLGMGTCQGQLCAYRAARILHGDDAEAMQDDLRRFLSERWKGMRPIAWGDTLAEAQFTAYIYQNLLGLRK
ncbi:MAG: anaerobic glycerol-3-phosphate dehydrogenase subunit A [Bacteroidales bacterium]|nr:anaerobic glycerol-3-phosphate dehydrogenase subunit A [Bacteroidales bacterium]